MKKTLIIITLMFIVFSFNTIAEENNTNELFNAINKHVNGNSTELKNFVLKFSQNVVNEISEPGKKIDVNNLGDDIVNAVYSNLKKNGIDPEGNVKISGDLLKSIFVMVDSQIKQHNNENMGFMGSLFGNKEKNIVTIDKLDLSNPQTTGLEISNEIINKVMEQTADLNLKILDFASKLNKNILENIDLSDTENMGENISNAVNKDVNDFLKGMGIDTED